MKQFFWIVILLTAAAELSAQQQPVSDFKNFNPRFEVFTLPGDELANAVQCIVQDSAGFLWFASQSGLHRYDGRNIVTFNSDPDNPNSLSADYVEDIFIDSKGILWLTHWQQGSLTSLDPEREIFTRYQHDPDDPESLSDGEMSVMVEDRKGYIWIGGQKGLNRLNRETGKFKRFKHDPGNPRSLSSDEIRVLYVDRQGVLWAGTGLAWNDNDPQQKIGGLNRYDPKTETFTRYMHDPADPQSLANNKVRAILEDSKGNFWVGTAGDGLQRMDRATGKFERLTFDPSNPNKLSRPYLRGMTPSTTPIFSHVTSIFEDRDGRIWITAVEGGLNVYDPVSGIVRHFEKGTGKDELTSNFLWQTTQTRDGTLWVTSAGEGRAVYKVKDRSDLFPFFDLKPSPEDSLANVWGIVKDPAGNVWIAQRRPLKLLRINRREGTVVNVPIGNPLDQPENIGGLTLDKEGNLWISTDKGTFSGDPQTAKFQLGQFKGDKIEVLESESPVYKTRKGQIWKGSWDFGLSSYDPKTGKTAHYQHNPDDPRSIGGNRVWGLYEDAKGDLWIGGGSPWIDQQNPLFLDRFNPQTNSFEHFIKTRQTGIAAGITEDDAGNIWFIDLTNGFQKLNPATGEIKKFTPANSRLPTREVRSITKAKDGKLWLGTEGSIIELDPKTETMSVFQASQGIRPAPGSYFNSSAAGDGELFFARKGGFHAFYPDQIYLNKETRLPDLRITGFRLLDDYSTPEDNPVLKKSIWQTSAIQLAHDQNVFSFSVACFDFYDPGVSTVQFMLEGYDRTWRGKDLRDGETPPYVNVPPGDYTFRVRGANSFGVWDMEGVRMQITILPPWWKTWWAYTIYGLLTLTAIFFFDRYQRRRIIQQERQRILQRELEQAKEIEKAYAELKATQAQLIQSEKLASLGELTAGIAHEIQNPLNFVNNFAELSSELMDEMAEEMGNGNTDEVKAIAGDIKQNLDKISHHGKRASNIVKGMLEHSRASNGVKEPTDLNALADEYLRLAYHGLRAKDKNFNATMKTDFDETVGNVPVIPQDMGRVILNLITNAFYAVTERKKQLGGNGQAFEPTVSVSSKKAGNKIVLSIKDNGNGIPAGVLDKIFQPFFTTKPTGQGTGLGLSLAYDIVVKGHGGELKVETKEGEGTEFMIHLPV